MNGFGLLMDNLDRILLASGDISPYSCAAHFRFLHLQM